MPKKNELNWVKAQNFTPSLPCHLSKRRDTVNPLKDEDWKPYKALILQLYKEEKRQLRDVMALVKEQKGFEASHSQYKHKIAEWTTNEGKKGKYLKIAQPDRVRLRNDVSSRESAGKKEHAFMDQSGTLLNTKSVKKMLKRHAEEDKDCPAPGRVTTVDGSDESPKITVCTPPGFPASSESNTPHSSTIVEPPKKRIRTSNASDTSSNQPRTPEDAMETPEDPQPIELCHEPSEAGAANARLGQSVPGMFEFVDASVTPDRARAEPTRSTTDVGDADIMECEDTVDPLQEINRICSELLGPEADNSILGKEIEGIDGVTANPLHSEIDGTDVVQLSKNFLEFGRQAILNANYSEAQMYFELAYPVLHRELGLENSCTITAIHGVGEALFFQGYGENARTLFDFILPIAVDMKFPATFEILRYKALCAEFLELEIQGAFREMHYSGPIEDYYQAYPGETFTRVFRRDIPLLADIAVDMESYTKNQVVSMVYREQCLTVQRDLMGSSTIGDRYVFETMIQKAYLSFKFEYFVQAMAIFLATSAMFELGHRFEDLMACCWLYLAGAESFYQSGLRNVALLEIKLQAARDVYELVHRRPQSYTSYQGVGTHNNEFHKKKLQSASLKILGGPHFNLKSVLKTRVKNNEEWPTGISGELSGLKWRSYYLADCVWSHMLQ